jgi:ribokinase
MSGAVRSGRVVVVGSLNVDLVARVDRLPRSGETVTGSDLVRTPGGKGLNQAVAAARSGAAVVMVGSIGDDDHGRWLRQVAVAEGIGVAGVATVDAATGTALITVGGAGVNTIVVSPGANGRTGGESLVAGLLDPADVVLCQAEIPSTAVTGALRSARSVGSTTVVNQAPFRPLDDEQWGLVDVLVVNETELAELRSARGAASDGSADDVSAARAHAEAEVAARGLLSDRPGPRALVVTLGRHGAVAVTAGGGTVVVAGRKVTAVDTVGAGDCLAGWLAAGLLEGLEIGDALDRAVLAASLAVQRPGAVAAMPRVTELGSGE